MNLNINKYFVYMIVYNDVDLKEKEDLKWIYPGFISKTYFVKTLQSFK